jgi:hypothetical protein
VWGIARHSTLLVLVGSAMLLLNPAFVSFPYLWLITNEVFAISLFMPLGVLIGGGACLLSGWLEQRLPRQIVLLRGAYAVALLALSLWGTANLQTIINAQTKIAAPTDEAAIDWIEENTPPDARFLINATAWFSNVDRGLDGGWWLLPLANRWTSLPPALYTHGAPDYVQHVHERSRAIATFQAGQEQQLFDLIEREGITHIYIRDFYIRPDGTRAEPPIMAEVFAGHSAFEQIYEQDGVTVFAVRGDI